MKNSVAVAVIVLSVFVTGAQVAAQPMYGSTRDGSVGIVDQTNGNFTLIGTPGDVLAGLDFNSLGQLFAVNNPPGSRNPSALVRIDPISGVLLATIGTVTDSVTTNPIRIVDLAFQPGTDVLFGLSSTGILYRISTTTAVATQVGDPGLGTGGLAFALNGTLYLATTSTRLATLDPTTAVALTNIPIIGSCIDGLAVRPSDGLLFGTECDGIPVWTIDPATGQGTNIGPAGGGAFDTADLAFLRPTAAAAGAPVLSAWGILGLAGLLLGCGAFLQRSRART